MSTKDSIHVEVRPLREGQAEASRAKRHQAAIEKDLQPYLDRQRENAKRAVSLVELSRAVKLSEIGDQSIGEDLLRATVVLTHAYLEDFLRTLAAVLLPEGGENCLDGIPLAGLRGRSDKFTLGNLVRHKGKLVDEILRESVSEHLENHTFNHKGDIEDLLTKLGFDFAESKEDLATIQGMIQRRHQIVHRADRVKLPASDTYILQPIQTSEVENWVLATHRFMTRLMKEKTLKSLPRILLR